MISQGIINLEVWTDCEQVIIGIQDITKAAAHTKMIMGHIINYTRSFNVFRIIKVDKEKIAKAHFLAASERKRCIVISSFSIYTLSEKKGTAMNNLPIFLY